MIRRRTSKNANLTLLNDGSFIGELRPVLFPVTGTGVVEASPDWLYCNGAVLSRTTFKRLFDAIGTAYNIGGEAGTDFRLPDFRGRSPLAVADGATGSDRVVGAVAGNATLRGVVGGADTVVLVKADTPRHVHAATGYTISGGSHQHGPGTLHVNATQNGGGSSTTHMRSDMTGLGRYPALLGATGFQVHTHPNANFAGSSASAGSGTAHNNVPPHSPARGMLIRC